MGKENFTSILAARVDWERKHKATYVLDIYYANYVIEFMIFRCQLWADLWVRLKGMEGACQLNVVPSFFVS